MATDKGLVAFPITFHMSSILVLVFFFQAFHASWIDFSNFYLTKKSSVCFSSRMCCRGATCSIVLQSQLIPAVSLLVPITCVFSPFSTGWWEFILLAPFKQPATRFIYPVRSSALLILTFAFGISSFLLPSFLFKLFFFYFLRMKTQIPLFSISFYNEDSFPVPRDSLFLGDLQYLKIF